MQTPMPTIAPTEARMNQTIPLELPAQQTEWLFTSVQMRRAAQNAMSARYCFAKRVLHIFGSGLLLMLLFVPWLIVALMVKITSSSLYKFPQLINVLRGEMSLVGPRLIVEAEQPIYGDQMQYYTLVHPGMTGLWQVSVPSNVSFARRVQLDCLYCTGWSLAGDVALLAKTIPAVVRKTGAY